MRNFELHACVQSTTLALDTCRTQDWTNACCFYCVHMLVSIFGCAMTLNCLRTHLNNPSRYPQQQRALVDIFHGQTNICRIGQAAIQPPGIIGGANGGAGSDAAASPEPLQNLAPEPLRNLCRTSLSGTGTAPEPCSGTSLRKRSGTSLFQNLSGISPEPGSEPLQHLSPEPLQNLGSERLRKLAPEPRSGISRTVPEPLRNLAPASLRHLAPKPLRNLLMGRSALLRSLNGQKTLKVKQMRKNTPPLVEPLSTECIAILSPEEPLSLQEPTRTHSVAHSIELSYDSFCRDRFCVVGFRKMMMTFIEPQCMELPRVTSLQPMYIPYRSSKQ